MSRYFFIGILTLLIYLPILIFIVRKDFRGRFSNVVSKKISDILREVFIGILYFLIIFFSFFEEIHLGFLAFVGILFYSLGIVFTYYGYYLFFKEKGLIKKKVFSISRNPTYFFGYVAVFGVILVTRSLLILVLHILLIFLTDKTIKNEEKYLMRVYKKEYREYAKKVRRYL
ncbi:MAG: methyltransferase [Candidatus Pacearchaeota archaeon]